MPTADEDSGGGWVDISRPLSQSTPVWTGDRPFVLHSHREQTFVVSWFETTCHIGTHVDAPLHLDESAAAVDRVPIGRCVGPADVVVVDASDLALTPDSFPPGWRPETPRVLIRTDTFGLDREIGPGFAALSAELAHWLADLDVELVGIDTPSVDLFESEEHPAHRALLERGLTWIEGLWLEGVGPGTYFLAALPMLIEGAEAAPVRAVLGPLRRQF